MSLRQLMHRAAEMEPVPLRLCIKRSPDTSAQVPPDKQATNYSQGAAWRSGRRERCLGDEFDQSRSGDPSSVWAWVNVRHGLLTPFAQLRLGGVWTSSGIEQIGWQNHFAMTAGGGIDVKLSKHFSIRPVQAEYFLTKIPDGLNNRQNNFRFSAGIVFRFG
jgi:hypothetical protein